MQPHPTRSALDLTVAGIVLLALGLVAQNAVLVAWAGSLLLGLQIARTVTLNSVSRVRHSGFEMLWSEPTITTRMSVGQTIGLRAEVRNRDDRAARYIGLRILHSPHLAVVIHPSSGEVPAEGRLAVDVQVTARRVGLHGIYGLSLELQGSPGLYEVPLTFSNPFGVEVLPRSYGRYLASPRGGRNRALGDSEHDGRRAGGSEVVREIRDYAPGDPFKRIAWKASARRGRLMTREFDQSERPIIWVVVDASVEHWSGRPGRSCLDESIEHAASLLEHHLARGERTGLAIVGHRILGWFAPTTGTAHAVKLMRHLVIDTGLHDADRSGLDEGEVATRVHEHLLPMVSGMAAQDSSNLDRLARRAATTIQRAPFREVTPKATSPREQLLRGHLLSFGIAVPPRLQPDQPRTDEQITTAIRSLLVERTRPNLIYICSPEPDQSRELLLKELGRLPRKGCELRWVPSLGHQSLPQAESPREIVVRGLLHWQRAVAHHAAKRGLRRARIGLQPVKLQTRRITSPLEPVHETRERQLG